MTDIIFAWMLAVGCVLAIVLATVAHLRAEKAEEAEFTVEETPPVKPRYVSEAEERFHTSNQIGR